MGIAMSTAAAVGTVSYLSVNNIEVIYDHVILVLKGVSLEVPEGNVVRFWGQTAPARARR